MNRLLLVILCLFSIIALSKAQNNISKLEKRLKTEKGKDKYETLYKLSKLYLTISPKKSIDYGNQAYDMAKKLKKQSMQANALNLIGTAYYKQKKYKSAIKYYEKELAIRKKLRQRVSKAKTLYNIGSVYEANNKEKKAFTAYKQALKAAKAIKYPGLVYKNYESIIRIYASQKNYKEAFTYLQEYNNYKGKAKGSYTKRKIDILETKYEEGKKELEEKESELNLIDSTLSIVQDEKEILEDEKEILEDEKETLKDDTIRKSLKISNLSTETKEQKLTIAEQEEEVRTQRQWLIAFASFFMVILIFSILLYKLYKAKKKANKILALQNAEIIEKNEEILIQSEQLLQRNRKIENQKKELEEQSEELEKHWNIALKSKAVILDSINYAKKIQKAVFPSTEYINEVLDDYFLLFKPRDIVSGDFYWIKKIENSIIIATADCTGHGVPGAFMSMLGTSFLNEIVRPRNMENTGEVLNLLRHKVKNSLGQKGRKNEAKDGMDMALYSINTETLELHYSGAHNPLYIIRENSEEELTILKADRQPIGIHIIEKEFTNHKYQLQKGDCLYTFSDGYTDQFGGEQGRKYKVKSFQEVLLANYKKPMSEQKEILNTNYEKWIGNKHNQIDDILVLGMKV
ncbi:MAG: SpoIIE family protein phosphatase [Bacteroidota bacterium]